MTNLLAQETSPYLLQHADNPVAWRGWNEAALAEARAADKPILLSVGYAACHWCHVMAHESFEDPAIAALMNEHFVCIKVDREERPDLDAIYQRALALMGEQGGWPLTMFLTPAGEPFWGGTYFPPAPRYGRPSFPQVLQGLAQAWKDKRDAVAANVKTLVGALDERAAANQDAVAVSVALVDQVAERLAQEFDPVHGGIKGAPKFPQCSILELVWRAGLRCDSATLKQLVTLSLDRMSQGGIYDHVGGGYARYSTDAVWLVPHFEKMLYDNAQLIDLLTSAWQTTGARLYAARVAETVEWLAREMIAEGDAFAATLDADSDGEEGKYYVWTEAEIDAALGEDAAAFKAAYDVTAAGNWEGHVILNRSQRMLLGDAGFEDKLAHGRAILFRLREERVRPGRDDKVLADWNGMMIAALARAGFAFGRVDWLQLATRAYAGITAQLVKDGRLHHSFRLGRLGAEGNLDDHAQMIRAALALHEMTGAPAYLDDAERWAEAVEGFFAAETGGYYFTASDAEGLIVRMRHAHDNATPSGNGVMAMNLARLFYLTGKAVYRRRAEGVIAAFSGELARNFFPLCTLLNAAVLLDQAVQVVIVGVRGEAGTDALLAAVARAAIPDLVLQVVAPGEGLAPAHPAHGKGQVGGKATAYVCRGPVCSAPVTAPADLAAAL